MTSIVHFPLQVKQDKANCLLIAVLCQLQNYPGEVFTPTHLRRQIVIHFDKNTEMLMKKYVSNVKYTVMSNIKNTTY